MRAIFNHPNFTRPLKWILSALFIKLLFYFLFIQADHSVRRNPVGMFQRSTDHNEYIRPIDNLFERGVYALDGKDEPYAGRLPGFVFPYIVFRAVFTEHTSNILLGTFILLLSALASYVLALLIFRLTKERFAFVASFFLMNCLPFFWHYDWTIHANSLGVSCTVLFMYFFYGYLNNTKNSDLLKAGFFLAWLVLLRGFCLVYIPVVLVYLFVFLFRSKKSFSSIIRSSLFLLLPFLIFESAWVTRNYLSLNKLVLFQTSFVPGSASRNPEYSNKYISKNSMMSVRKLIFDWGGDNTWYFPNADMAWFVKEKDPIINDFKFDDRIFFEGFTMDSLRSLKTTIIYSYTQELDEKRQDSVEHVIETTAERYHQRFCANKKGYLYLIAPFKRLKNYILRNVTQDWPGPSFKDSNLLQKGCKLLSLFEYLLILVCLVLFPVVVFKKRIDHKNYLSLLYILALTNVLSFMWLINFAHYSYFMFAYCLSLPLLIVSIVSLIPRKGNG
jgi:4-amino-4-deoxy-L-arabinose transferase-like glycosyltransferase